MKHVNFSIYATGWFVMPPRRRLAQYLEEQTLRADEEVKRKVEDIERRLREEEAVVDEDVYRKTKLYVVRKKFLDEIAGELATVQEKYQKAIIQKEIDNLSKLRDAYMELGDKVQQKMNIYEASVLATAGATKNIGNHVASRAEQQLKAYMQQSDDEEAARIERENGTNAEKQQRIAEMHENMTFSMTKSRTYKRMAAQTSNVKEKLWFLKLELAYGEEYVRTKHILNDLESGEKAFVWNADRQDVKAWIDEYWKRCHRAFIRDEMMTVLIRERSIYVHAKDDIFAMSARSGVRTLEMNEKLASITEEVEKSDQRIDDFFDTGVAAGGDGDKVIVTAPPTIERKARSVLGRFELLLLTRKEHIETGGEYMGDFEGVADNLRSDMESHLRYVERQYDKQEKARSEVMQQAAAGPMQQAAAWSLRRAAAGGTELAMSRYVRHIEKPLTWSMGKNTAEAFDGHVYWCVYEVNVTVENGKRREGIACNYEIEVPEGQSLFAVMNAKVPFYDWARVRSKSYVLEDKDMPQQVDWRKSYGDPADEIDCLHEIDEFGRRIVANKDVTVCHIYLYRISNGF